MQGPYKRLILRIPFTCALVASNPAIAAPTSIISRPDHSSSFACGGSVEQRVWALWDGGVKDSVRSHLIEERLLGNGDTYALYDLQTILSNLVAMADRCDRDTRLVQIADTLLPIFNKLETLPPPN